MEPLIEIKKASLEFKKNTILEDINLNIYENDYIGIVGPNGGGKTCLIKLILGLYSPTSGSINKRPSLKIGYVPQFSSFNHDFPATVEQTILLGTMTPQKKNSFTKQDYRNLNRNIELFGLNSIKKELIRNLSGGETQRMLLARAFMNEVELLLLDEPTASVDSIYKKRIYELLEEQNKNTAIIIVTHDFGVISSSVKNVACLNKELIYHKENSDISSSLNKVYGCPIDLIAHGTPHRVYQEHEEE